MLAKLPELLVIFLYKNLKKYRRSSHAKIYLLSFFAPYVEWLILDYFWFLRIVNGKIYIEIISGYATLEY